MQTEENELKNKTIKTLKGKEPFRKEISGRLSLSECEKIWRDVHKRLYKMYAEHQDLPKGVAMHTDSFIFPAAAIYLAMKESDPDMALAYRVDIIKRGLNKYVSYREKHSTGDAYHTFVWKKGLFGTLP